MTAPTDRAIVNQMVNYRPSLDGVFAALADPTRRRIVERLALGELTVGEIADEFPISGPAISKHLRVLERTGLLERNVVGRVHRCRLAPETMREATAWLDAQERFWNARLDQLEALLARQSANDKPKPPHSSPRNQRRKKKT